MVGILIPIDLAAYAASASLVCVLVFLSLNSVYNKWIKPRTSAPWHYWYETFAGLVLVLGFMCAGGGFVFWIMDYLGK